jgi:protein pelota
MKILSRNMREQTLKVQAETSEDLWHLERVLEKGDLITSRTFRKASIKSGGEYEYGDKKPVVLTIKLEKMEYNKDSGVLRLNGPIAAGPEDVPLNSYHSLQIETGTVLSVQKKRWKAHQVDRLEKAKVKKAKLFICVLDREDADFAVLSEAGIEMKARITNYDRENMEKYYAEIVAYLNTQDAQTFVIGGPGFERENLLKHINANHKELAKKIILEHASSTGINGIQEILKKSANRILKETRVAKEAEYVNEIMKRMKTDGLVVYGPKETEKAIRMGAVETLFVSQEKVDEFERLMDAEEKMAGNVVIIGSDHELGEQFLHLGGIAGFLRFKTDF